MPIINGTPGDDGIVGTPGDDVINGDSGNDTLRGLGGNDTVNGDDGHDFVTGDAGDDSLHGGNGDDYIRGSEGDDVVDGGAGFDRAAFNIIGADTPTGATVDLNIQGVAQNTGHGMDTLIGIEHVSGTIYNDVLTGDAGDNWIWGQDGDDVLSGNDGNDLIEVGVGNHTVSGGSGADTLSFADATAMTAGVSLSLALQGAAQATGYGSVNAIGLENLSGSQFDDTLSGDGNNNAIAGHAGDDSLSGGGGNDTLLGDGAVLPDTHGTGFSGPITTVDDVAAFFADPTASGNDTLDGGDGDDTIRGGGGDDLLIGGSGNDTLDGGAGFDTASFADSTSAVVVSMGPGFAQNDTDTDTLSSIEAVVLSAHDDTFIGSANDDTASGEDGNDLLRGRAGNDTLNGGGGHDYLMGGDGNDSLAGGSGDDYLRGAEGDDVIDGGAGFDRAAFTVINANPAIGESGAAVGATVDLNIQGVAQNTGHGMDTLIGIEHVSGTTYNDVLTGNGGDNWVWGEGGNDTLSGGGGNDLVEVDAGNSVMDGGSGTDTAGFYGSDTFTSGVSVSLALQGGAQTVAAGSSMTLTNFENLTGTRQNDSLTGDGGDNVLAGADGADTLSGGAGNDTLYGDGQILPDTHGTGRSGPIVTVADVAVFSGGSSVDGDDTLDGGKGDDTFYGGGGADTLTGGKGADTFHFSAGDGGDTITDFNGKEGDVIRVHGYSSYTLTQVGKDVMISFSPTDYIILEKTKVKQVSAGDIVLDSSSAKLAGGSTGKASDGFGGSHETRGGVDGSGHPLDTLTAFDRAAAAPEGPRIHISHHDDGTPGFGLVSGVDWLI
jgi:Ca2+-binding RTX toxin-like protein